MNYSFFLQQFNQLGNLKYIFLHSALGWLFKIFRVGLIKTVNKVSILNNLIIQV